ncbi:hypothetical protein [Cellulosimicrobium sp. NPDC057862]|uniref:hypothetical protein n=1 Tax=Actinomycetes TaxID=1760 RepID=UPI003670354F
MTTTGTAALVTAVETTWTAIRENHPDTPEVIVTVGAGSGGRGGGLTLGHFAPSRWVRGEDDVHELFVGGEGLARGAAAVLGTLLHEAAHGIASTREIQDTSRQGRYHNKKFRALAAEVGIEVEHSQQLGYSTTTVPDATAQRYAAEVAALAAAMSAYRRAEVGAEGRTSNNNGASLVCGCGRKIRASRSVVEAGPILCGLCGEPFAAPEEDEG